MVVLDRLEKTGATMKIVLLAPMLLLLSSVAASAQSVIPPEIVRPESVHIDGHVKIITVGNAKRRYTLSCNIKADGCITPEPGKNYLLFNRNTRWKLPNATEFITLTFFQDWLVKYTEGENIGLVSQEPNGDLGIFLLRDWEHRQ
jgi:hypothetical protein